MKWIKENAAAELEKLAEQTRMLQELKRNCEEHIRWIAKTRRFLLEVFGEESIYFTTFASFTWRKHGGYAIGGPTRPNETFNPQLGVERVNQDAYVKELGVARGLLFAAKDELEEVEIGEVYKGKNTELVSTKAKNKKLKKKSWFSMSNPFVSITASLIVIILGAVIWYLVDKYGLPLKFGSN